jgi:hypothetical protein
VMAHSKPTCCLASCRWRRSVPMPRRPMNKLGEDSSTYNVRVNGQPKNQQNISKYVNIMKIIGNKSETHRFDMA